MPVHADRAAVERRAAAKTVVPESLADEHGQPAGRKVAVGEVAPEQQGRRHHLEIIARHQHRPALVRLSAGADTDGEAVFRDDGVEGRGVSQQVPVVGQRSAAVRVARGLRHDPAKPVGVADAADLEEQGIHRVKRDGIDTDADGEGEHGQGGEPGPPGKRAYRVAQID